MATSTLNTHKKLLPVPMFASIHHSDPFILIERQSKQLQNDLQVLLDAQSAGLSAGLPSVSNDSFSNRSSTPTPAHLTSPRAPMTIPVRQPPKKEISLRGARRGILKTMDGLLTLKEEERRIIGFELRSRREAVREADMFVTKQRGLESALSDMQGDQETLRVENLKRESRSLEKEILQLETRLSEMKARHGQIFNEITQLQNSIDSKLSSYKESLALVRKDAQNYLATPPIQPLLVNSADKPTFYSLHPKRRTLEMAKEHWQNESMELRKRKRNVDNEISALREGGEVWHKVISTISAFEKSMQEKTSQVSEKSRNGAVDTSIPDSIVRDMNDTMRQLESNLQLAEEKNWNLLICSIGAELEAFREGRSVFMEMLGYHDNEHSGNEGLTAVGNIPEELLRVTDSLSPQPHLEVDPGEHAENPLNNDIAHLSQDGPVRTNNNDEQDQVFLFSKLD
ncbi:hypothetical protein PRK78_004705 [Emydomyces testavorans]|uniref:Atg28p n=1 Tax=Emydomyces testavorans TaxID=2070801 RepID=A0AAF0DI70_9EURO|nr:hypothetical protein PRK78_004705 [Emydomyces testavorans]